MGPMQDILTKCNKKQPLLPSSPGLIFSGPVRSGPGLKNFLVRVFTSGLGFVFFPTRVLELYVLLISTFFRRI